MLPPERLRSHVPVLFALALAAPPLDAEPGPLEDLGAEIRLLAPTNRSNGPFGVRVTLRSRRPRVVTGRLEILLREDGDVAGRFRSPEWSLAPGEQSYRLLIPPLEGALIPEMLAELRFRVAGEESVIELGVHRLPAASVTKRSQVILACGLSDAPYALLASLRFESLHPELLKKRPTVTRVTSEPPENLPRRPLDYCAFDLVVLAAGEFARLEKKQLEAIADWVEAGGSLLVAPGWAVKSAQLAFLNRLGAASSEEAEPVFRVDDQNRLAADPRLLEGEILRLRSGLGRAAVLFRAPRDDELESASWRGLVAFLWKLRAGLELQVRRRGKIADDYELPRGLAPQAIDTGGRLLEAFVPEGFRLLPVGLVFLVLLVFFLMVGPLEGLILGRSRRYRLTWVLTPALSLGFTLLVISLAEHYMGGVNARKTLTVYDLGPNGRLLRQNRYEILLLSGNARMRREVKGHLVSVMSRREIDSETLLETASPEEPPLYSGDVPRRYTLELRVAKWSPRIVRSFSIGGELAPGVPALNWDAVQPADLRSPARRSRLKSILAAADFPGSIHLYHGDRILRISGKVPASWRPILDAASVRGADGLFSLVSRISPNGGGYFEDLALVDTEESREWLLVVAVPRGDDMIVLRRLYRGGRR